MFSIFVIIRGGCFDVGYPIFWNPPPLQSGDCDVSHPGGVARVDNTAGLIHQCNEEEAFLWFPYARNGPFLKSILLMQIFVNVVFVAYKYSLFIDCLQL